MVLRFNFEPVIDNPRNYPPEVVEKLRTLLTQGAPATLDPHRKRFYEVENGERVFYMHLAPNGSVWLLATWQKDQPAVLAHKEALAQQACACGA